MDIEVQTQSKPEVHAVQDASAVPQQKQEALPLPLKSLPSAKRMKQPAASFRNGLLMTPAMMKKCGQKSSNSSKRTGSHRESASVIKPIALDSGPLVPSPIRAVILILLPGSTGC